MKSSSRKNQLWYYYLVSPSISDIHLSRLAKESLAIHLAGSTAASYKNINLRLVFEKNYDLFLIEKTAHRKVGYTEIIFHKRKSLFQGVNRYPNYTFVFSFFCYQKHRYINIHEHFQIICFSLRLF